MWISLIAAVARNGVIGRDNRVPWHLGDDLRFFRRTTLDKPVVMGRRTFESIGRPLPRRHNIVLTRDKRWRADGCTVVHSVEEALAAAAGAEEVMVIGGAHVYEQFLPLADRMYLTVVEADVAGDTVFPPFATAEWQEMGRESYSADARNDFDFTIVTLERLD